MEIYAENVVGRERIELLLLLHKEEAGGMEDEAQSR
jgi:hypothetical protein